ncbi:MAG: polyphenol oxidase family protein [Propionibacteriaceae bacterium]
MQTIIRPDVSFGVGAAFCSDVGRPNVDEPQRYQHKQEETCAALGVSRIAVVHQIHSATVSDVDEDFFTREPPAADALVTRLGDVALCARGADCLPILFASADGVIGACHAGRVGFLAGVIPATVARMRELGATAIEAWIGPHICGQCYEVPDGLRRAVAEQHPAAWGQTSWGTPSVDLGAAALAQLAALDVDAHDLGICTLEQPQWHSARRAGDDSYGSNGAVVFLDSGVAAASVPCGQVPSN